MTYGTVNWTTYFDIVKDLPLLVLQFILSPLPILHNQNPLALKLLLIDVIFVALVLFSASRVKLRFSNIYWANIYSSCRDFSIWEFYIGGAVRHRLPLIIMMLPVATLYLSTVLSKLTVNNDKP